MTALPAAAPAVNRQLIAVLSRHFQQRATCELRERLATLHARAAVARAAERGCVEAEGPSAQALQSLGVLSPGAVDRLCNEQSTAAYVVEDCLRVKSVNIAAGDSGIGKSPLVCQLALCVAAERDFLGMAVRQGRVLYLDLENPLQDHQAMRNALVRHLGLAAVPDSFFVITDARRERLEEQIKIVRPSLVVIDSLRAFAPEVTAKNSDAGVWLSEIRKLA